MAASTLAACSMGCDVELFPDVVEEATRNTCESDTDCGGGSCRRGICQTNATEIPALLLQVTPPAGTRRVEGSPHIGGLSFISVIDQFEWDGSGYEINLGHVSLVTGSVSVPQLSGEGCVTDPENDPVMEPVAATDGTVPARITLTPAVGQMLKTGSAAKFAGAVSVAVVLLGDGQVGAQVQLEIQSGGEQSDEASRSGGG